VPVFFPAGRRRTLSAVSDRVPWPPSTTPLPAHSGSVAAGRAARRATGVPLAHELFGPNQALRLPNARVPVSLPAAPVSLSIARGIASHSRSTLSRLAWSRRSGRASALERGADLIRCDPRDHEAAAATCRLDLPLPSPP